MTNSCLWLNKRHYRYLGLYVVEWSDNSD